jgi:hypothetical protein
MTDEQPAKKKRHRSDKPRRDKITPVRWTSDQFNEVAGQARKTGLSFGAFIRSLALKDGPGARSIRIPSVNAQILLQVKGMIGSVGNNVNQIARGINMGDFYDLPELRLVLRQILRITDLILVALGKDPSPELEDWDKFSNSAKAIFSADPGAKTITLPAEIVRRVIENTHARAILHPSERPLTGLEPEAPSDGKPPSSKFLSPEGHA